MKCEFCGGKLKVVRTAEIENKVVRYRKCKKCGATSKTVEN